MMPPDRSRPLELWGGIECTINRIGDRFVDQLELADAYRREELVEAIAGLGLRKVRWPALWEHTAPRGVAQADWSWCDATLPALRSKGIEPIVGLVHHGSGPVSTSLLDATFADQLAEYALAFARRYPWVRWYTPINEPLTTARFSALYGHWYPHRRDDGAFVAALLNQTRATILAMTAIRTATPEAGLICTEDASFTSSTPELAKQAAFENERRWLSLDLMTGRLTADHPLWPYLHASGMSTDDRDWFVSHAVMPEVIGLNYYVTSDRFLDHRLELHPAAARGGNGVSTYVDVEAARAEGVGIRGHAQVLVEAGERYQLPVAITETHIDCSREEQMRWLRDAWTGAIAAREQGADVRAVTAWALLGSTDWDSLVTRVDGHYESGFFDLRSEPLRPTALVRIAQDLVARGDSDHPLLTAGGWWSAAGRPAGRSAPLMILGGSGTLGQEFAHACRRRGITAVAITSAELDFLDAEAVRAAIAASRPWAVINTVGYSPVGVDIDAIDHAEHEAAVCRRLNAIVPAILAMACRKAGVRLLTFSSDMVFDGDRHLPYTEPDLVAPLNVYGRSKAEAERRVLALNPAALVVRTGASFGALGEADFVTRTLGELSSRRRVLASNDSTVSPTYTPDLVEASLNLLIDEARGVWHLANVGAVTWFALAEMAAKSAGLDASGIEPCTWASFGLPATRPRYSALASGRGPLMPVLGQSIERYVYERRRVGSAA